jgi:hypothetical protein
MKNPKKVSRIAIGIALFLSLGTGTMMTALGDGPQDCPCDAFPTNYGCPNLTVNRVIYDCEGEPCTCTGADVQAD